jgi:hypothetical protein
MTHLSNEQMSGYARRTLDAEGLLVADDHLSGCDDCRNRLIDVEGLRETIESLRGDLHAALGAPTGHLPYDQIEARAEGRLRGAAREIAETHIEHCAACARQARDLEAFAAAFRARVQEHAAATASAPATTAVPPPAVASSPLRPAATAEISADAARALVGAAAAPARSRLWPIVLGLLAAMVVAAALLGTGVGREQIGRLNDAVEDLSRPDQEPAAQTVENVPPRADPDPTAEEQDLATPQPAAPQPATPPGQAPPQPLAATPPSEEMPPAAPAAPVVAPAAAPAAPAVSLQDERGLVGLDGSGNLLGLDGVPPADAKTIAAALQRGSLEVPDDVRVLSTIPKAIQLDDSATGMPLLSGAATYVRTTRPTLAWQTVEGAQVYTIVLFNQQGRPLYYGGPTGETAWTPPAPLQRGVVYTWRVAAYRPGAGGTVPPSEKLAGAVSRFRVIDAASASTLERALRANPGSRVVAGVLYARAGLLDDAGREFRALLAQNPDSGLAKALLASVEAARLP